MVEDMNNAPAPPGGAEETTGEPPQPMEAKWLFHLFAGHHWASLDQVVASQNAANQQMWDQVA